MKAVHLFQWARRRLGSCRRILLPLSVGACLLCCAAIAWGLLSSASGCGDGTTAARAAGTKASSARGSSAADAPARTLPLPGEFERQKALLLGCNELVPLYSDVFVNVVAAAYRTTRIIGLVSRDEHAQMGAALLQRHGLPADAVRFVRMPINSMWVRDYGPLFLRRADGSVFVAEADYVQEDNVRGKRPLDDEAARWLGRSLRLPVVSVPLQLEGGNLLSNGKGVCTTTTVFIQANLRGRRPEQIAAVLERRFGVKQCVFFPRLAGEPSGHVDMLMTFVAPNVAVVGRYDPAVDPVNARILDRCAALLAQVKTSRGPMQVHRIPMPPRQGSFWRTYTNVIFANGTLLMPTFAGVDPSVEQRAIALYARLLPGWKVVGIPADRLAPSQGLLHCFSMNVPEYVSLKALESASGDPRPASWQIDTTGALGAVR